MSGCGDTGDSNTGGNQQQYGQCQNLTIQPCQCGNGATGIQRCENSVWGVCTCGSGPMGTGGFITGTGGFGPPPGGQSGSVCGDGVITGGEQCDGQNQNNQTCQSFTIGACSSGYLICNGQCQFDTSMCTGCGGQGQGGSGASLGQGGSGATFAQGGTTGQP